MGGGEGNDGTRNLEAEQKRRTQVQLETLAANLGIKIGGLLEIRLKDQAKQSQNPGMGPDIIWFDERFYSTADRRKAGYVAGISAEEVEITDAWDYDRNKPCQTAGCGGVLVSWKAIKTYKVIQTTQEED